MKPYKSKIISTDKYSKLFQFLQYYSENKKRMPMKQLLKAYKGAIHTNCTRAMMVMGLIDENKKWLYDKPIDKFLISAFVYTQTRVYLDHPALITKNLNKLGFEAVQKAFDWTKHYRTPGYTRTSTNRTLDDGDKNINLYKVESMNMSSQNKTVVEVKDNVATDRIEYIVEFSILEIFQYMELEFKSLKIGKSLTLPRVFNVMFTKNQNSENSIDVDIYLSPDSTYPEVTYTMTSGKRKIKVVKHDKETVGIYIP